MIVVDTNILTYLCLQNRYVEAVGELMRKEPTWCAPILWRSELRNVLIGYVRRGELVLERAMTMQAETEAFLHGNEHMPDSRDVLKLAQASGCTAYDCEFVALAETLGVPLVTSDMRVLKAFPEIAITPAEFTQRDRA
jgi:predicted nucleic acid-binding protein